MRMRAAAFTVAALLACSVPGEADTAAPVTVVSQTRDHGAVKLVLRASDRSGTGIARTEYRLDGGPWTTYQAPLVPLLDRTSASFARWQHVGPGSFERRVDGSVVTRGGLGMLWFPSRAFGDVAFHLQWQDVGGGSNGGVIIRFPDP
jgi:hypothetical protein